MSPNSRQITPMEVKVSTQTFTAHCPSITEVNLEKVHERFQAYKASSSPDEFETNFKTFTDINFSGRSASKKNFLNCVSLKTYKDTHKKSKQIIDLKIFNNGVIQLAGCKEYLDTLPAIRLIIQSFFKLNSEDPSILSFTEPKPRSVDVYIVSAMRNVFFNLGFKIKRDTLRDYFICNKHDLNPPDQFDKQIRISAPLTGFTGVQIYFPIKDLSNLSIHRLKFQPEILNEATDVLVPLSDLWLLKPKLEKQRRNKPASVSISIFQTGNVLMSGIDFEFQDPIFTWFIAKVDQIRGQIEVPQDTTESKGQVVTFTEYIHPKQLTLPS